MNKARKTNLLLGLMLGALVVYIFYSMGVVFIWGDA